MELIDIGANLSHDSFDHDRDAVLQRAREAGVAQMVVTGASREHSPKALALAQAHPGFLFATAGVHPHHATEYTDECDAEMRALLAHAGSGRGRRMRAGLFPRFLAAPGAAQGVRAATADRADLAITGASRCSCTSATRTTISWR